jgi:hypothetical protein
MLVRVCLSSLIDVHVYVRINIPDIRTHERIPPPFHLSSLQLVLVILLEIDHLAKNVDPRLVNESVWLVDRSVGRSIVKFKQR